MQYGCDDAYLTCLGASCAACVAIDPSLPIATNCPHDTIERHHGMRALAPEPSRVPTKPIPPIALETSIKIRLGDDDAAEQFARFLEEVAKVTRVTNHIELVVRPAK